MIPRLVVGWRERLWMSNGLASQLTILHDPRSRTLASLPPKPQLQTLLMQRRTSVETLSELAIVDIGMHAIRHTSLRQVSRGVRKVVVLRPGTVWMDFTKGLAHYESHFWDFVG